jgi:hypothetical protein
MMRTIQPAALRRGARDGVGAPGEGLKGIRACCETAKPPNGKGGIVAYLPGDHVTAMPPVTHIVRDKLIWLGADAGKRQNTSSGFRAAARCLTHDATKTNIKYICHIIATFFYD